MSWVVVGYTPDQFGAVALEHAVFEARQRGRGVAVVNGTKGDVYVDDRFADSDALAAVEAELAGTGLEFTVRQTMGSDVAEQVITVAEELEARLIVLGLRKRSAVGKLLMGSVAQRVILDATCPVLCVKPGSAPG